MQKILYSRYKSTNMNKDVILFKRKMYDRMQISVSSIPKA